MLNRVLNCHIVLSILLIFCRSSGRSAFSYDIIGQREPGEATSSLIQASGLVANNDQNKSQELFQNSSQVDGSNQSSTERMISHPGRNSMDLLSKPNITLPPGGISHAGSRHPMINGITIVNGVIFVIGLCGNAVVILVICKFTKTITVTDIYIGNLAAADIMFTTGLLFLITTMLLEHWIFGSLMCKLYMATTSLNQFASSLLLVVMSYDRYLAVCHPIYAQRVRHTRKAKTVCALIWVVCIILMIPILTFAKLSPDSTCAISWPEYKSFNCELAFTLYSFLLGFFVPVLLIAGFYFCIVRKLRSTASGTINTASSRRSRSRETTNRRVEHLVVWIIFIYTLCWLPYWISQLLVSFYSSMVSPIEIFYDFFLIATSLSYTNSALNPILYAFLSDNFKRRCIDVVNSIYAINFFHKNPGESQSGANQGPQSTTICPTNQSEQGRLLSTTFCQTNQSESGRPESRQTVFLNEAVCLIQDPIIFNTESKT